MKIIFSDEADSDLLAIVSYFASRDRTVASRLAADFDFQISNLARFPLMGRDRSSLAEGLRSILVWSYVVFYRIVDNKVLIARVLDGRRDLDSEFRE